MIMDSEFKPRPIEWTPVKVQRFWAWLSAHAGGHTEYFSKQAGGEVIDFARAHGAIGARVLDFGCGLGHLIEHLLARGVAAAGLDVSEESVRETRARCGAHRLFRGAVHAPTLPSSFADGSFDTVFLIETIEHLLPDDLARTLGEIHRLLAPGGHLIITTPNDEDLDRSQVMCPECGATFHRMQHVRAFSPVTMKQVLAEHAFDTVVAETRTLRRRSLLNPVRDFVRRRIRGKKDLNLFAIGRRR